MASRRIIYVLEPFPSPHGGVGVIYRHVEILMAHGFSAFVHLPERPEIDFYQTSARQLIGGFALDTSDILVIPEILGWALRQFKPLPIRRLMFCQSHMLPPLEHPRDALAQWGVHGIIASSAAIRNDLQSNYGLSDIPLIPCAVDATRFAPARHKKRQIAYMPRKRPEEAAAIEAEFKRRHARADVPWVPIDQVPQTEVARILSESSVFLSLPADRESLGLPPLEAMASGCLVVGYHGEGGREYINDLNGWWAETGDRGSCVDGLAAALDVFAGGGPDLEARRSAMAATVDGYSPRRMEAALLDFWQRELGT